VLPIGEIGLIAGHGIILYYVSSYKALAAAAVSGYSVDNDPPGSRGNGGNMATSGNVAMATGGDSDPEPVTSTMIAAGISQLPPMDMDLNEISELLRNVYRAMRSVRGK
jgi:hypothetical protein